jgi:hypothetical protein
MRGLNPFSGGPVIAQILKLTIYLAWLLIVGIAWAIIQTWQALITRPQQKRAAVRIEADRCRQWDQYLMAQQEQRRRAEQAAWWQFSGPGWQPDAFVPAAQPAPEPVGNTDQGTDCWFCSHPKAAHEDDYRCAMPQCGCEAEQYARPPVWQPGGPQRSLDKQFLRDWSAGLDWDRRPPGPAIPPDVVTATQARYTELFTRLTRGE